MRILAVTRSFRPGPTEDAYGRACREVLTRIGRHHEVSVLTAAGPDPNLDADLRIYASLPEELVLSGTWRPAVPEVVAQIAGLTAALDPDLIYLWDIQGLGPIGALVTAAISRPTVWHLVGSAPVVLASKAGAPPFELGAFRSVLALCAAVQTSQAAAALDVDPFRLVVRQPLWELARARESPSLARPGLGSAGGAGAAAQTGRGLRLVQLGFPGPGLNALVGAVIELTHRYPASLSLQLTGPDTRRMHQVLAGLPDGCPPGTISFSPKPEGVFDLAVLTAGGDDPVAFEPLDALQCSAALMAVGGHPDLEPLRPGSDYLDLAEPFTSASLADRIWAAWTTGALPRLAESLSEALDSGEPSVSAVEQFLELARLSTPPFPGPEAARRVLARQSVAWFDREVVTRAAPTLLRYRFVDAVIERGDRAGVPWRRLVRVARGLRPGPPR